MVLMLQVLLTASSAAVAAVQQRPCDIYEAAGAPCVAAHSTVRALYANYVGPLYQVHRTFDNKTAVVAVNPDTGFAQSETQKTFCPPSTICSIICIFDQSPNGNHLEKVVVPSPNLHGWPENGPNAMREELTVGGNAVFSAYFEGGQDNIINTTGSGTMGFRSNHANGTAVGDEPESMYMVVSGTHYNGGCCFDYGNSEITNAVESPRLPGNMEALYFGYTHGAAHPGAGKGPWVMADLENGVWAGADPTLNPTNTPIDNASFVTAMLKGKTGTFQLAGGDTQSGPLKTLYSGPRPDGYTPMKKQGAIVLGIGGDNSDFGIGTFYEGALTATYTSDETDAAVHANIIAAGYGK